MKIILDYIKRNNNEENYTLFNISNNDLNSKNEEICDTLLNDFPNKTNVDLIKNTLWLGEYKYYYFGLYKNKIISFSEDGLFAPFCENLEDLPFEILRRESKSFDYADEGKLKKEDVLENISSFKTNLFEYLKEYNDFLNKNNIKVNKVYFKGNEYRSLYEYFIIDYQHKDFYIDNLEGKEFINIF